MVTECQKFNHWGDWRVTHIQTGYAIPGHFPSVKIAKKAAIMCLRRVPEIKQAHTVKEFRKLVKNSPGLKVRLKAVTFALVAWGAAQAMVGP